MSVLPYKIGAVWNANTMLAPENTVILANDDPRADNIDRIPNPIVIPVNVYAKQTEVPREPGCNQAVDVIPGNKCIQRGQVVLPINGVILNARHVWLASINHETA